MTRLTPGQVRSRALMTVVLVIVTIALLALGMIYARDNVWFVVLILFIDLPAILILSVVERFWRTES